MSNTAVMKTLTPPQQGQSFAVFVTRQSTRGVCALCREPYFQSCCNRSVSADSSINERHDNWQEIEQ